MKYAMSGHKGLIGRKLKERLDEEGHEATFLYDKRDKPVSSSDFMDIRFGDINAEIFFHLAAHCKIQEGTDNPELPHYSNVRGIHNILETVRKNYIPKFVNFSSSRALGTQMNPYVASKLYTENLTEAYGKCYGLEWLTIRPSTVYGPGHDKTGRLLSKWIESAIFEDGDLPIYGDENKTLDFTYVNDFIDGIMLLLDNWDEAKGVAYNISGNEETKLTDVAKIIQEETGRGHIVFEEPEIEQPQQVNVDTKLIRMFGYKPKIKIREGIKQMIDFYIKNGRKE